VENQPFPDDFLRKPRVFHIYVSSPQGIFCGFRWLTPLHLDGPCSVDPEALDWWVAPSEPEIFPTKHNDFSMRKPMCSTYLDIVLIMWAMSDKSRTLTNAWLRFMYLLVKLHYIYCACIYIYVTFKLLGSNFKAISSHIFQKSIIELYQIPWMLHIQIYILTQLRLTHVHASFLRTKDTPCKTHMLLPDMISTVISLITIYSEYHIYRYNNILYMYIYV
jgi:hypothetical protein